MTSQIVETEQVLAGLAPFCELASPRLAWLAAQAELRHYPLGHTLLSCSEQPEHVWVILQGTVRSLGSWPEPAGTHRTLEKLESGDLVGWIGLLHNTPLEHLRTSTEVQALALPACAIEKLLTEEQAFQRWCACQLPAAELLVLLHATRDSDSYAREALENWPQTLQQARLWSGFKQAPTAENLDPQLRWYISQPPLSPKAFSLEQTTLPSGANWFRLIGLEIPKDQPASDHLIQQPGAASALRLHNQSPSSEPVFDFPVAPAFQQVGQPPISVSRAAGPRAVPLAICLAIASHFHVPVNRDALYDQIEAILQRQKQLNLINYGQLISSLGLNVVLSELPGRQLNRVPTPAVLFFHQRAGLLDGVDRSDTTQLARILEPELGPVRLPTTELMDPESGLVELLLIERHPNSKTSRFSWNWYAPYLNPHRRELIEVLASSAVVNTLALVTPLGLQVLIDQVARTPNSAGALISISAVLLLSSLVGAIMRALRSLIFTNVANRVDQATKSAILDQLVRLPQSFFDKRPVGQITFYFSQLDRLREFLISQSLTTVVDFGFSLLYVAVLLAINPLLTLVTLSTIPLFITLGLISNPIIDRLIQRSIEQAIRTYSYLNEAITGIQTIKAQNGELKARWEFQNRYARFIGEDFKLRVTAETINSLATFINDLNGLLVIGFGIYLVTQNQLTLGAFIAFRIISGYITGPLVKLVSTWQQLKQANENLRLVGDVVDRPTEQSEAEAGNLPMPALQGKVEIRDVSFRFNNNDPLVLHNVTLSVPSGSFVGVVGGSGSGKSTLLKLLPRFYRPEIGQVLIDGFDISKVELYSLRRQIGVVPQESLLFDGTVKENLLMVKPDATAEELIRAAKITCAHEFIMAMPHGYNSSVGERGAGLSGGQRQRIALARAVLQNPRMLILDEATSALDAHTERQLCMNLFEAFRGRTVFFITHRLSTVRPADMIVLMDRGAIMEVGAHSELMQRRGWYYALHQSQSQEGLS